MWRPPSQSGLRSYEKWNRRAARAIWSLASRSLSTASRCNFTDPNREIEGERSSLRAPHPFLTDRAVRQAMSLAIDREALATEIFGASDLVLPARNILTGIPALESPNTSYEYDLEAAINLLEEAGWSRQGSTRVKDGIELAVSYYTGVSATNDQFKWYRPEIQVAVQAAWEAIGIEVQLGQLPGDEFFDDSPDNLQSYNHFYCDVEMFSSDPSSPLPFPFFEDWYAGPDNSNVAQRENDWYGINIQRYVNPEFDALFEELTMTTDPERAADLLIQLNDLIVGDFVVVPLVARPDDIVALSNRIAVENVAPSFWEPLFWNIANWRTVNEEAASAAEFKRCPTAPEHRTNSTYETFRRGGGVGVAVGPVGVPTASAIVRSGIATREKTHTVDELAPLT